MAHLIQFFNNSQLQQKKDKQSCLNGEKLDHILMSLKKSLCLGGTQVIRLDKQTMDNRVELMFTAQVDGRSQLFYHFCLTHSLIIRSRIVIVQKDNYLMVRSGQIRKNICKTIASINVLPKRSPIFLMINPSIGFFQLLHSCYLGRDQEKQRLAASLKTAIAECLVFCKNFNSLLLYKTNLISKYSLLRDQSQRIRGYFFGQTGQFSKLQIIRQNLSLSNLKISNSMKEAKKSKYDCQYHQSMNIQKLIEIYYNRVYPHQIVLYSQSGFVGRPRLAKQISQNFQNQMLTYKPKPCGNFDNNFLFSTIFLDLKDSENTKQQCILQNTKVKLLLLQVKLKYGLTHPSNDMQYLLSEEAFKEEANIQNQFDPASSKPIDKIVVIKMPNPKLLPQVRKQTQEMINHEKMILRSLRGAQCTYLPKYYQTTQNISQLKNFLLIDYIPGPTLCDVLAKNFAWKTFPWKISLLMHLSNALRFLESYDIVHLDLSVNNIIITKEGTPKIIDFGEAYHQQVLQKYLQDRKISQPSHLPGQTFPFAAPETTQRNWKFTCKQDIFSMGIIAFKMIMGYFPNSCSETRIEQFYWNKNYSESIFFSPEGVEWVAETEIMMACMQLIINCLHNSQKMRPYPSWSHLIFKKIFQVIQETLFS